MFVSELVVWLRPNAAAIWVPDFSEEEIAAGPEVHDWGSIRGWHESLKLLEADGYNVEDPAGSFPCPNEIGDPGTLHVFLSDTGNSEGIYDVVKTFVSNR
jgi:hypothetical protein